MPLLDDYNKDCSNSKIKAALSLQQQTNSINDHASFCHNEPSTYDKLSGRVLEHICDVHIFNKVTMNIFGYCHNKLNILFSLGCHKVGSAMMCSGQCMPVTHLWKLTCAILVCKSTTQNQSGNSTILLASTIFRRLHKITLCCHGIPCNLRNRSMAT